MANFTHYRVKTDEQTKILANTEDCEIQQDFLTTMQEKMQIKMIYLDDETCVFDLIGVDVSIANALRRILLAEVPTMAIETVYIQVKKCSLFSFIVLSV